MKSSKPRGRATLTCNLPLDVACAIYELAERMDTSVNRILNEICAYAAEHAYVGMTYNRKLTVLFRDGMSGRDVEESSRLVEYVDVTPAMMAFTDDASEDAAPEMMKGSNDVLVDDDSASNVCEADKTAENREADAGSAPVDYVASALERVMNMLDGLGKEMLEPMECARLFHIGRNTMYAMFKRGDFPYIPTGCRGMRRIPVDKLKDWIKANVNSSYAIIRNNI